MKIHKGECSLCGEIEKITTKARRTLRFTKCSVLVKNHRRGTENTEKSAEKSYIRRFSINHRVMQSKSAVEIQR